MRLMGLLPQAWQIGQEETRSDCQELFFLFKTVPSQSLNGVSARRSQRNLRVLREVVAESLKIKKSGRRRGL